jgi:hypothetical protein
MARTWTREYTFVAGAVRYRNLGYLALTDDSVNVMEFRHSAFLAWDDGEWGKLETVPWLALSFSICHYPIEQGIALSEWGNVLLMGSNDVHEELVRDGENDPETRGFLRRVRGIAGKAYAAGMDRQVYRRDDRDRWTCIVQSMRPVRGAEVVGFEGIDGYSESEIYAAGWRGEIWQFDGSRWREIDSPTNFILTNLICGGDGMVYACGRVGLLLRGRGDAWEVIEHGRARDDFWGLAWFNDHLYVCGSRRLFRLEGDDLERVHFGDELPDTCYHLSSADGVLWSVGAKDVMSFDGTTWSRIDGP